MSASTSKASTPNKQPSRFRSMLFPLGFIGVGILVATIFGYLQATVVIGLEFDTGTWTVRSFWYRRDPFSGRQLTGILRETPVALSPTTAGFPNSYFSSTNSTPPRWDLISLRSSGVMTEGPAKVLKSYFDGYFSDQLWPSWSSGNVVKANVLWPAARDLVDLALYHELPKIMELAKVDSTDAEFRTLISDRMHAALEAHIEKLSVEEDVDELNVAKTMLAKYAQSP